MFSATRQRLLLLPAQIGQSRTANLERYFTFEYFDRVLFVVGPISLQQFYPPLYDFRSTEYAVTCNLYVFINRTPCDVSEASTWPVVVVAVIASRLPLHGLFCSSVNSGILWLLATARCLSPPYGS